MQVVLDESDKPTTGSITTYSVPDYAVASQTQNVSANGDATFTVTAKHDLVIKADIITGSGKRTSVSWEQHLSFENVQQYLDNAGYQVRFQTFRWGESPASDDSIQTVRQISSGTTTSKHNGLVVVKDDFSYPLDIDFYNVVDNGNPGCNTILIPQLSHKSLTSIAPMQILQSSNTRMTVQTCPAH